MGRESVSLVDVDGMLRSAGESVLYLSKVRSMELFGLRVTKSLSVVSVGR